MGRSGLEVFVSQFTSGLVLVLVEAAALSVAVGHVVDAVLITIILLANGIFGFVQEHRAEHGDLHHEDRCEGIRDGVRL